MELWIVTDTQHACTKVLFIRYIDVYICKCSKLAEDLDVSINQPSIDSLTAQVVG